MSLSIARAVNQKYPHLLQENTGASCHMFTVHLIEHLRAAGFSAFLMVKTQGEGQYTPLGFQPRDVMGFDGKMYHCTGVSHDAIWCEGRQFDTITSANDSDQPIFKSNGEQIRGEAVWNPIPQEFWRPNNPPLKMEPVISPPLTPKPSPPVLPKGEAFALLKALDAFYRAPEGLQRPEGIGGDMEAIAQWFYQLVIERVTLEQVFAQIRASHEWRSKHGQS